MTGSCRISIDWIMRGASTCFCAIRISWPNDIRMADSFSLWLHGPALQQATGLQ
jgi:hypothetical protein